MNRFLLSLLWCATIGPAAAQQSFPVSELTVDGIYATRTRDPTLYCLLGANTCIVRMPANAVNRDPLIPAWLAAHSQATVTVISQHRWLESPTRLQPHAYLWIEQGDDSLNLALVREGRYPAAAMQDMVEADRRDALEDPDSHLAKERAATPEANRPHRLISEADYADKMARVMAAELLAQRSKRGIWSEAGLKGRSPPTDAYLIHQNQEHTQWFDRIRELTASDDRLRSINRDPRTAEIARQAGSSQLAIAEYQRLITALDANETLVGVDGMGTVCLVISDITVGLFDNGIIKGYVYSPTEPSPLIDDLTHWPDSLDHDNTAYRRISDHWYLFELHH
jgi:hypothetical protein